MLEPGDGTLCTLSRVTAPRIGPRSSDVSVKRCGGEKCTGGVDIDTLVGAAAGNVDRFTSSTKCGSWRHEAMIASTCVSCSPVGLSDVERRSTPGLSLKRADASVTGSIAFACSNNPPPQATTHTGTKAYSC